MKGALYLVATPIGNLGDITLRALKVLRECDFIAAEDTRVTSKLLSHFEISKPVIICQKFNVREAGKEIVSRLRDGLTCALVTDAGTPGISDPGQEVAALCVSEGLPVISVPGACACIVALTSSGFPAGGFVFCGFPGVKKAELEKSLSPLAGETRTAVLYEAPHRLKKTLEAMRDILGGDRKIALCRELTKLNEEIIRTDVSGALEKYTSEEPRGEYVIVVHGAEQSGRFWGNMSVREHYDFYLKNGLERMDALKQVARDRGVSKNEIYKALL
ncbi:MAG: 16S rRNA (cytidine(1402)-2'-O)-methyltransferase [Clostridia bacterium]|nr:16S rRNA (cytidine(1402)-2'-O)-methyltransferase [Clostridia bacterium]